MSATTTTTTTEPNIKAAQSAKDELWHPSWKDSYGESTIQNHLPNKNNNKNKELTFYCSWFCPFAQRAWISLEEHKVPYTYIEINPYEVDTKEIGGYTKKALTMEEKKKLHPGFVEASPRGLVPAIRHEVRVSDDDNEKKVKDLVVWESLHVVEYIDSVWGGKNEGYLIPKNDPHKCAMVRIWTDHCTDRIQKQYYNALVAQEESKQQQALLAFFEECRALARAMDAEGPFFLGKEFSLVDVALAPFWLRFVVVGGYYRNLEFPKGEVEFERLGIWWEATKKRESVKATLVCEERLIASYKQYSKNEATSDFAKSL